MDKLCNTEPGLQGEAGNEAKSQVGGRAGEEGERGWKRETELPKWKYSYEATDFSNPPAFKFI